MSQAPHPFTQAASQGYGDYSATLDDEDQNEPLEDEEQQIDDDEPEGPASPEPEENDTDEYGFTQTQERSYPTGIESPDEAENEDQHETSDNEIGPSSPQPNDSHEQQENNDDVDHENTSRNRSQSYGRRRVQIMNDSDNDDETEVQHDESTKTMNKEKNRDFLKQFTITTDDSHKKHKKRKNDEHHHHHHHHHHRSDKSKRLRKSSVDEDQHENEQHQAEEIEATSDVEDVVDDIFGKDGNENDDDINDQDEVAAELADLNDDERVQDEEQEEEDDSEQQIFDNQEDDDDTIEQQKDKTISKNSSNIVYDIDLYLERKAEKRRGNRRRGGKNGDIDLVGPDADEIASKLIDQMKIATEEDRIFNKSRQPATAKLLLLPKVEQYLCRADLTEIFLDHGILSVFKDWLSPLPDKTLPNIKTRESIIKILEQFGTINSDALRDSGIGKALMYLYKHPRETKDNKIKLIKIIHDWARPIFKLETDYKSLTPEERQQRDVTQATLKRQTSSTGKQKNRSADVDLPFASDRRKDDDDLNKDDDCPRARVPRPSHKDYVVRPVSTIDYSDRKGEDERRSVSRLDMIKRRHQERKRSSKPMSVVKLSIEGNKMHL